MPAPAGRPAIVTRRWRFAAVLTAAMMAVYFGFILLVAFAKPTMGTLVAPGLSLGILLGAGVIAFAWIITGLYVRWANRVYDPAVEAMRADAFAIAASSSFPALVLSITFRRYTTRGAVASLVTGTVSALGLIALSPTIQVDVLHRASAIVPLKNPAIISLPLSFVVGVVVSLLAPEETSDARWDEMEERLHLGATSADD